MPRCRFCDQTNPAGATRCASCGAELPADEAAIASVSPASAGRQDDAGEAFERRIVSVLETRGKIAAIKEYRESTGTGLKEAKDAVEALVARHGVQPARGAGCGAAAAVLLALAVAAWQTLK